MIKVKFITIISLLLFLIFSGNISAADAETKPESDTAVEEKLKKADAISESSATDDQNKEPENEEEEEEEEEEPECD